MTRFLTINGLGKVSRSFQPKSISIVSQGSIHGTLVGGGLCYFKHGLYSQVLFPGKGHVLNAKRDLGKGFYNGYIRGYSTNYVSNTMAHHAQMAWKSLAQAIVNNGRNRFPIEKVAQAFSLGLKRYSYMVVPGIFGLLRGTQLAWAQATPNAYTIDSRNKLYMRCAHDTYVFLKKLLISIFRWILLLFRALYLAILFLPCIVMSPFVDWSGPRFRRFWLVIIRGTLSSAGPTFTKWGQWAATRPDLFPIDLCAELSKLHTQAPEHSFSYTKKTIERAFGRKLSEIFDDFEVDPLASGSIAQIHRATLRSTYHDREMKPMLVTVKVRHPGIGEFIKRDLEIINIVAKMSSYIPGLSWLSLDESVQQFEVFMMSQVDLANEDAHLSRFVYNFRTWDDISFPKPVYPLVHPAVLVETFEHGESVACYVDDELESNERLRSSLAHIGTHASLKVLLEDNLVHVDVHHGNILVRVAHTKSSHRKLYKTKPHDVVFLDIRMPAELSKNDRVNLLEVFYKAIARKNDTSRLSKKQNCPKPEAFIKEVNESFDIWGTLEGDLVHPADCMHQLLEKVGGHKVNNFIFMAMFAFLWFRF